MALRFLNFAVALMLCVSCGTAAADQFVLSEDDLPEAVAGEYRVAFTRNGAITIAREGKWLFDAGLGYMVSGWSEWGTQIRRSSPTDGWTVEGNGEALLFKGTLFDTGSKPRFTFSQRVEIIPGGLRVNYTMTANDKRPIEAAGLAAHMPAELYGGGAVEFRPGLSHMGLPKLAGKSVMGAANGRMAVLLGGDAIAGFLGHTSLRWQLLDDREWNLNTFRIIGWDETFAAKLSLGGPAEFGCDILLGDMARERAVVGEVECVLDAVGWAAVSVAGQARLRGGLARFAEGGLEFLTGTAGTAKGDAGAAFDVSCSKDEEEATLTYRWLGKDPPGENGPCRILIAARLPAGASVADAESGMAVTPEAAPAAVGNALVLSWKEGAKVARAEDGTYSVTWERNPKIRISSDRPWTVKKEGDFVFLSIEIGEADGTASGVPVRLRPLN
jgi:hypothetical protein